MSLNSAHGEVYSTTLCDKVCQWLTTGQWFSPGTPVSSTNKTDPPQYNWNIVESGIKPYKPANQQNVTLLDKVFFSNYNV